MSCDFPIFERPLMPSLAASRRSSRTVIAPAPLPVPLEAPRFLAAAFAPSPPSADRVDRDSLEIVRLLRAARCAFSTLRRAACRCFSVLIGVTYPGLGRQKCRHGHGCSAGTDALGLQRGIESRREELVHRLGGGTLLGNDPLRERRDLVGAGAPGRTLQ